MSPDAGQPVVEDASVDDVSIVVDEDADAAPSCVNLECQIPMCDSSDGTTIVGEVRDPLDKHGLYNAFVYIPNAPLDPIASGVAKTCQSCMAPASGKPLVSAVTDAKGKFTLKNVPAGVNIPLVAQIGKWRKKITVPNVVACSAATAKIVLPKSIPTGSDDAMPHIAVTTGSCDALECFLQAGIGIDPSEFTGPTGKGHVHVFRGMDNNPIFPNGNGDAYQLWGDLASMKKYDALIQGCECNPNNRNQQGMGYANMKAYLDAGGRMFGTHYHYNWFAPPDGPSDFQSQASWVATSTSPPYQIDTSHPRGKAFGDWLDTYGITMNGQLPLNYAAADVDALNGGAMGHGNYKNTTGWIYGSGQTPYLTFNTPTTSMKQCGRAAFADVHLEQGGSGGTFPSYCPAMAQDVSRATVEFLFFDLFGCVQDDTKAPITPPTQ